MKIILVGASGTIGKYVETRLKKAGHEVIPAGRSRVKMEDRASVAAFYKQIGSFDAVAVAAGHVTFKPLLSLSDADWQESMGSKFLGQVNLVQEAIPYIRDRGSFTLITGVTSREPIRDGAAAAATNRAVEGFAMSAAAELPRGLRINVVSPTVLEDSMEAYKDYFGGHVPVSGAAVAEAYLKAITGLMSGQILVP